MAGIVCKQCGYENPEGSTICEICAEELEIQAAVTPPIAQSANETSTVKQVPQTAEDGKEYFVLCPESQTKTILSHGKVNRFFCEGCKKEHDIDGFLWDIESKEKQTATTEFE